jgi:cytochrome c biogenesis protein CcmG/thiol:disulfide interchange protein DsbE
MLDRMGDGRFDPRGVPSALLGRAAPEAPLAPLEGATPFTMASLRQAGRPVLVNFFASWCVPCLIEHPQLMRLAAEGTPVFGIAYKDRPQDARAFLARHGDPFRGLAADPEGRVAVEWGVYGVPETYLLDRGGLVRWRWAGPITADVLAQDLRPLIARHA